MFALTVLLARCASRLPETENSEVRGVHCKSGTDQGEGNMRDVYLNQIATAVPDQDVHEKFVACAPCLLSEERHRLLFRRMAERAHI